MRGVSSRLLRPLAYLWASPWTLAALSLGILAAGCGDSLYLHRGVIVCHGPWLSRLLRRVPIRGGAAAMTIGHVVLARDAASLQRCLSHELVHVRQYERWGPLFVPAYFIASVAAALAGGDPYRDNGFEREAFGAVGSERERDSQDE